MSYPQQQEFHVQPPSPDSRGVGAGITSLVCGALIIPSMFVTALPSLLAALFTRPDKGSNGLDWVAQAVFWSLPVLFGLLCAILGITAVRRSERQTTAWTTGVSGLCLLASEPAFYLAWAAVPGEFRALF
jgi:hypothetical protein